MTFYLQARTERALKEDGNLSDATVFSAFAAKDQSNASIHVELNVAKDGVYYLNFNVLKSDRNSSTTQYISLISPSQDSIAVQVFKEACQSAGMQMNQREIE